MCIYEWDTHIRRILAQNKWVYFAKEPYKRDYILQKRPIILRRLLIVATPYDAYWHTKLLFGAHMYTHMYIHMQNHMQI